MDCPLCMLDRSASLFDEDTPGIREFHKPSLVAIKKVKAEIFFEVRNLSAECRLADAQSVRCTCEVKFLS
jgi:hypothetical protein